MKRIAFILLISFACSSMVYSQFATSKYASARASLTYAKTTFDPASPTAPHAIRAAHDRGDFQVGVVLGLMLSKLKYDYNPEEKFKAGPYFGGRLYYWLSSQLVLQTGLLLAFNGTAFSDGKLNMTSLLIPLMVGYMILPQLMVMAGFQPSFILGAKDEDGSDYNDVFKGISLGFTLGVSYQIAENLAAELMYEQGLTNISDYEFDDGFEFDIKTQAIMIGLLYTIFRK